MQWLVTCLYCHGHVYHLKDGRIQCSQCTQRISRHKINKIMTLISSYVHNESAYSSAKRLGLSYLSVQQYYEEFRILSAAICEREYEMCRHFSCEYEEYFYLEHSKRHCKEAVFDAHNFLTFDYNTHIYNLLLPSLQHYKQQFINDNLTDTYLNEFNSFKRKSKIIKVSSRINSIVTFWEYLEKALRKYRGIQHKNFAYFLKECEFKYNHTKASAQELLIDEYFTTGR